MSERTQTADFEITLEPDCLPAIKFAVFLHGAAKDETMFDNVWRRAKRRIEAQGHFPPAGQDGSQPDPYLLMLAAMGVRSYKAFEGVLGSELTVAEMFSQEPVDRMWLFDGPPGSGKSLLLERLIKSVEGEFFYMLEGCPNNCRPQSLLRLMTVEQVNRLPPQCGSKERLLEERARAVELCDHCKNKIFGKRDAPEKAPRLDSVMIQPVKLFAREGHGIATWTPSDGPHAVPLEEALRRGTHLCILRQPFPYERNAGVRTQAFHCLLEVVQGGHCLPDSTPYGGLVAVETNDEGWVKFIKSVNDAGAFKRRMTVIRQPYLRSVSRELRLYESALAEIAETKRAPFDPFVLESLAVLAVWSRQKTRDRLTVPYRGAEVTLDLDDRMRILDGDLLRLQLRFDLFRGEGAGWKRAQYSTGGDPGERVAQMLKAFLDASDHMEGFGGLSGAFMKEQVVIPLACSERTDLATPEGRRQRITFLEAVAYLRRVINEQMTSKDAEADSNQSKMYRDCLSVLDLDSTAAFIVESWYRRRLVQAMELAFFPDLEELRHALFADYYNLATAISAGQQRYTNHAGRETEASSDAIAAALAPIEARIAGIGNQKEAREFRARLKARCQQYLEAEAQRRGIEEGLLEPTWDTIPEIAQAIAAILTAKNLKEVQACLDERYSPGAGEPPRDTEADARLRQEALQRLQATGYSDYSFQAMLRYFRANKLWAYSSTL